ncbi:hypothetical protein, partial [Prevotella nigrescens]|uniref:hypothetical protein n=1 Tax=Prevotella nigrescens TaxID=28133 RepID=UPI003C70C7DF
STCNQYPCKGIDRHPCKGIDRYPNKGIRRRCGIPTVAGSIYRQSSCHRSCCQGCMVSLTFRHVRQDMTEWFSGHLRTVQGMMVRRE